MIKLRILFSLLILIGLCSSVNAQEYEYSESEIYRPKWRKILNQFSVSVSTGFNSTTYKHDLSGFYYLQSDNQQLIVPDNGTIITSDYNGPAINNWFNRPSSTTADPEEIIYDVPLIALDRPVLNDAIKSGFTVFHTDSIGLGFKGRGWDIPINISLRYNFRDFRIGGGVSFALHKVNSLKPTVDNRGIRVYHPLRKTTWFKKYYGQLGYQFYDWWDYSFAGEVEIGKHQLGNQFSVSNGIYYNFGISIEKNLSEYFRVFVKPSYDIRSFRTSVPNAGSIRHRYNAFNVGVGVSITFPEIPRSPMKSDRIQLKHVIRDPKTGRYTEVRGQPIWKKQNPKVGQNHRKMIKYKWRNRNKINPY